MSLDNQIMLSFRNLIAKAVDLDHLPDQKILPANILALKLVTFDINTITFLNNYCSNLKQLDLNLCQEHIVSQMSKVTKLSKLNIALCGDSFETLLGLKNVKSLTLWWSKLTDIQFTKIVDGMPQLQSLSMNASTKQFFSPECISKVLQLKNLKSFGLFNVVCFIPTHAVKTILSLKQLQNLQFEWCSFINENDLYQIKEMSNLTKLNLNKCNIDKQTILDILQSSPQIIKVNIGKSILNIDDYNDLTKNSPKIRSVQLQQCTITDDILETISFNLKDIQQLTLNKNYDITEQGISSIVNRHLNILILNLSQCNNIKNQSLIQISKLKKLQQLNLNSTNVSQKGLTYLRKLQNLRILHLYNNNVSIEIIIKLEIGLKLLKKIFVGTMFQCAKNENQIKNIGEVSNTWIKLYQ